MVAKEAEAAKTKGETKERRGPASIARRKATYRKIASTILKTKETNRTTIKTKKRKANRTDVAAAEPRDLEAVEDPGVTTTVVTPTVARLAKRIQILHLCSKSG